MLIFLLRTYRILKDRFCFEAYLNDNIFISYKQLLVKFRGGLLGLRANTGRVESIPYNERICPICKSDIETEYFLLVCPYYEEFIPSYFYMYPSEIKCKSLLTKNNVDVRIKICQYLIQALKLRKEIVHERT